MPLLSLIWRTGLFAELFSDHLQIAERNVLQSFPLWLQPSSLLVRNPVPPPMLFTSFPCFFSNHTFQASPCASFLSLVCSARFELVAWGSKSSVEILRASRLFQGESPPEDQEALEASFWAVGEPSGVFLYSVRF